MSLPPGFVVELGLHTQVIDGGAALIGGSPTRLLRFSTKARRAIHGRQVSTDEPTGAALADRLLQAGLAHPVLKAIPAFATAYTIVIPIQDRVAQLDRLLVSLVGHESPERILVIDDGSRRPAEVERCAGRHGVGLIAQRENRGPAAARNLGLRHVKTPFVVFVDSDVVVERGAISTLLRHFHDPRVALVAPRIGALRPGRNWVERYESARSSLDLGPEPAAVYPGSRVGWVPSTFVVGRVQALGDGFDPTMRVGEDVDLVWRLVESGHRVRYEPGVVVAHEHRSDLRSFIATKFSYGTSAAALGKRHPAAIAPAILAPWGAAVVVALVAQRGWSLPVALAATVIATNRISERLGDITQPERAAVRLAGQGLVAAAGQASALLLRHWWPLTLLGAACSKRVRRAAVAAAIADVAVEYARLRPALDPLRFGLLRRVDDLAYGAGVWWSAIRGGSLAALRPVIRR